MNAHRPDRVAFRYWHRRGVLYVRVTCAACSLVAISYEDPDDMLGMSEFALAKAVLDDEHRREAR